MSNGMTLGEKLSPRGPYGWAYGVIAVIIIVACAVWLIFGGGYQANPSGSKGNWVAMDDKTGELFEVTVKQGDTAPYKNPKTGEKTLYDAYICNKCNTIFLPPREELPGGGFRIPMAPKCPECGSTDTGGLSIFKYRDLKKKGQLKVYKK